MNAITAGAIDCDIHPGVPGIRTLLPYMNDHWQDAFVSRGADDFDLASYPTAAPITCRDDWRPTQGKPGTDFTLLQSQALDAFGTRFAICNPLYGGAVAVSESMGAAICSAINDWMRDQWLSRDPRLRASIVVPAQAPHLAVEEIERLAGDHRFVQILLPAAAELLYGKSYYWPIWQTAVKHGLPVGIHAGSMFRYAPTSNGWPSHYLHDYVSQSQVFEDQLLSLVTEGIFVRFPELRIVLLESGVTWLPGFLWRHRKTWRGVRAEVPWVDRPPPDIIRDHVRLTMQPFDAPPDPQVVAEMCDMIGSDDMLLFATDYPHWQFDATDAVPIGFPPDLLRKAMFDNPMSAYPRLKETVA
ncbi:amidohydrolase family protein [Dankookia rubra]|uniref:amidohydrolase family protein n=1 Tax=Dankookia rubra TaxID=1442381 RepID=UPI0019D5EC00|nr:amidohydrolase family protein [Dankookia rubra]